MFYSLITEKICYSPLINSGFSHLTNTERNNLIKTRIGINYIRIQLLVTTQKTLFFLNVFSFHIINNMPNIKSINNNLSTERIK